MCAFVRFRNKKADAERLSEFGFVRDGDVYSYSGKLLEGYNVDILISDDGRISIKVLDSNGVECDSVQSADDKGINDVTLACRSLLYKVSDECFNDVFHEEQSREIIDHVWNEYHCLPEYLWSKFPDNAVFRRKTDQKWFAAILTVRANKIGREGNEILEVIDLKETPENIKAMLDGKKYLPGYHMNKEHWYTIVLDGSVDTEEIFERISTSFIL